MENNSRPIFSSRTPHFFKIIFQETLRDNKLRIPHKFVRKYGETLSTRVYVKLPCGSEWKMGLLKHDDGQVWFKMGWPEFVKYYSIQRGDLLFFQYQGNSKFNVVICDTTTVEINYPIDPANVNESGVDREPRVPKKEVTEDDFVEILDDPSTHCKRKEKTASPCSRPEKRMRTSRVGKTQSSVPHSKHGGSKTVLHKPIRKGVSKSFRPEMKGKQDLLVKNDTAKPGITRRGRSETNGRMTPIEGSRRTAVLSKASGFKSSYPFVKVLLQSSSATLTLPAKFAKKYLKNKSVAILKVAGGRTWPVKYVFEPHKGSSIARFRSGWNGFAKDNNLGVGDICVFVLRNRTRIMFDVEIFRVNENSNAPKFRAPRAKVTKAKPEESLTDETESCDMPSSREKLLAKQANGCKSTAKSQCRLMPPEKARILKRTPFKSRRPFFKSIMQPTYVCVSSGHDSYVNVPRDFATRYIKDYEGEVLLLASNDRSWPARLYTWPAQAAKSARIASGGWRAFVEDNNLKVGDVCIFELVKRTEISLSFQVSIVRRADYDKCHRHSQDGDSSSGGGEISGYRKMKTRLQRKSL